MPCELKTVCNVLNYVNESEIAKCGCYSVCQERKIRMKFNLLKRTSLLSMVVCMIAAATSVFASDDQQVETDNISERLHIEFIEPEKFTDIRPSNQSRAHFTKQVLTQFSEYFDEIAQKLPDGQVLDVKVTDIDLAGDTRSPRFSLSSMLSEVRVVEHIFFPRLEFEYEVKDKNGEVLQAQAVSIKDMNFMNRNLISHNRNRFPYEKRLLDDWYRDTFVQSAKVTE